MRTSLNHQPEVHHPKSPAIRWAADYPIYAHSGDADLDTRAVPLATEYRVVDGSVLPYLLHLLQDSINVEGC